MGRGATLRESRTRKEPIYRKSAICRSFSTSNACSTTCMRTIERTHRFKRDYRREFRRHRRQALPAMKFASSAYVGALPHKANIG